jgi:hypothetical protein
MKKHFIQSAIKHPGALRRKAAAAGESTNVFAVAPKHDSGVTGDEARLAVTLRKINGRWENK